MSATKNAAASLIRRRPLHVCARASGLRQSSLRNLSSTAAVCDGSIEQSSSGSSLEPRSGTEALDAASPKDPLRFAGSARRRAALRASPNVPFEQLPYQCFQEARKILMEDRQEKLRQIQIERERILKLQRQHSAADGGEHTKQRRLRSMQKHLEKLKILADINDPVIKKRFEDGEGDMNRPIYRYLADKQWRSYRRQVVMQRVTQMNVIPDLLPTIDPTADVRLAFSRHNVQPGDFVESRISEVPAKLRVQVFDKGERLVSIVVVDADVPDVEGDKFDFRCHFLAANIAISPTSTSVPFTASAVRERTILPWLPPWAQKGTPYHRLAIFVLQQREGEILDVSSMKERIQRDGFNLRSFIDKYHVHPVGVNMFRSQWDEGTAAVMARAGIEGADVEFRRMRIGPMKTPQEPLKKKKNRIGLPSKRL